MKFGLNMQSIAVLALGASTLAISNGAVAQPRGEANGYWAGRLCDHVGPTTGGVTYWEHRGYKNRGQCVQAEGRSLAKGEWDPGDLDPDLYPI